MSSPGFEFFKRVGDERLERDISGNTLKKYNGTGTSWPTHSKVQMFGESHQSQQDGLRDAQANITEFFKNL